MKPVVGITSDVSPGGHKPRGKKEEATYFLRARYAQAIEDLGGIPFILPPIENSILQARLLDGIDGLLISGSGPDLDPRFYGERKKIRFSLMDRKRALFELSLARKAVRRDLPVLGICGGLQSLNVALGGSLIQDIPEQVSGALTHRKKITRSSSLHWVTINPRTRLRRILGQRSIRVNSSHHQAACRVANGLIVNALASDGIVEGVESPHSRFVVAVQWHPELLYRKDESARKLFRSFLRAAARKRREIT